MKTKLTYLGGATYLIEVGSFRFLTDPGFDPKGTEKSEGPGHDLKKNMGPPLPVEEVGKIDAVFVSHTQHYDNLDNAAKAMLPKWGRVLTTPDGAAALGGSTEALNTWESVELTNDNGEKVRVTAGSKMGSLRGRLPPVPPSVPPRCRCVFQAEFLT